ncbi:hypothetical protein C2G38_2051232 [Gigaspora rosea]|uniref:Protein kinase domain-containing protein n=1 Tax=Gigaspora rosea TaxID=44941 RepID=A0A397TX65_9GLOM|nr:hypothetical protein C2G38_2051232 [Gigaspora rosea]
MMIPTIKNYSELKLEGEKEKKKDKTPPLSLYLCYDRLVLRWAHVMTGSPTIDWRSDSDGLGVICDVVALMVSSSFSGGFDSKYYCGRLLMLPILCWQIFFFTTCYVILRRLFLEINRQISNNLEIDDNLKTILTESKYPLFWIPYNEFENDKHIGQGGFATVYCAEWTEWTDKHGFVR